VLGNQVDIGGSVLRVSRFDGYAITEIRLEVAEPTPPTDDEDDED
jgi:predicted NBD/HSP70 family sugar kinase